MPKSQKFVEILYDLLENKEFHNIICWNQQGNGFTIIDRNAISQILTQYFNHQTITSFQRQLGMYGFRLQIDSNGKYYTNPNFRQGCRNKLISIKRKIGICRKQYNLFAKHDQLKKQLELIKLQQQEIQGMLIIQMNLMKKTQEQMLKIVEINKARKKCVQDNTHPFKIMFEKLVSGMLPGFKEFYNDLFMQVFSEYSHISTPIPVQQQQLSETDQIIWINLIEQERNTQVRVPLKKISLENLQNWLNSQMS